jgi:hypothetical protein
MARPTGPWASYAVQEKTVRYVWLRSCYTRVRKPFSNRYNKICHLRHIRVMRPRWRIQKEGTAMRIVICDDEDSEIKKIRAHISKAIDRCGIPVTFVEYNNPTAMLFAMDKDDPSTWP